QSANVLDRRPDLIRLCCGCNLFSYSSHAPSHSDAANRVSSPNQTIATRESRQALAKLVLILASCLLNRHYGLAWVLGENCCRLRGLAEAAGPFVLLHCRRGPVLALSRALITALAFSAYAYLCDRTLAAPVPKTRSHGLLAIGRVHRRA